jgi:hypothetical protein
MVLTGIETVKVAVICTGHVSHKDSEIILNFSGTTGKNPESSG